MAKGNMLQGMARGKVGDIVFSRLNGEQISRVRNRNPKNPRTNAQLYQRAIMATVMQAYSAGKEIFDHSFQGKSVGAANQRRFMSLNAKKLRDQIAADINGNVAVANQVGRVVAPGSVVPTTACLQVSEGTYDMSCFIITPASIVGQTTNTAQFHLPSPTGATSVADYCQKNGIIPGDVYTFVVFAAYRLSNTTETIEEALTNNTGAEFFYCRMTVKDNVLSNEGTSYKYKDIFNIETSSNGSSFNEDNSVSENLTASIFVKGKTGYTNNGVFGIIRSRKDSDLRSTCELQLIKPIYDAANANGIISSKIIEIWSAGTAQLGDSDLILEGGNFDGVDPIQGGSGD